MLRFYIDSLTKYNLCGYCLSACGYKGERWVNARMFIGMSHMSTLLPLRVFRELLVQ